MERIMKILNSDHLECVEKCEFLKETSIKKVSKITDGRWRCSFHKTILESRENKIFRCKQCERHEHYKILVDHLNKVIDKYNFFVKDMDIDIDILCYLLKKVDDKI